MPSAAPTAAELLPLLRGVSRSFYLSVRVLPGPLRHPIGLAYLLARATDTVADAPGLPAAARLELLDALDAAIQAAAMPLSLAQRLAQAGEGLPDACEAALLRALPGCFAALAGLSAGDRAATQAVLREIASGQRLDLQRFPGTGAPRALADEAEAVDYMQRVAGCVGGFWTAMCAAHLPGFAELPEAQMRALGESLGRGLQRINILRDAGADLAAGRCYFPASRLQALGLTAATLAARPGALRPLWDDWIAQAAVAMDDGMRYALGLRSRRLRVACALPALVGLRTLALLRAAGPAQALAQRVKMPRAELRALLAGIALTLAGRGHLERTWHRLRDNGAP
ncbi:MULTISPECIES: squalene/phytoene synthase family protein [Ramlibacter]|uniref:Squalene/phytoene synthase family protein n=1 Tax=Ramlibacter aquaticus TaxID=2780094 RepID=A0ABR9SCH8_9BURK|nr:MULTISPECIES: squalene/phytoene synthase family protein [Ramlibacter]MBE7940059.1 squalene/phytoene synthase family protein [Ramlibacter aquaticus]